MSSITGRMKTRPQRARAPEDPYQSPSSKHDQVTDDATSPSGPNPINHNDGSTHNNRDASSNDPNVQPQAKVNPKILDPIKEDKLQELESKLQEMEMATKSLPTKRTSLEKFETALPSCRLPPTYQH